MEKNLRQIYFIEDGLCMVSGIDRTCMDIIIDALNWLRLQ